ncbi:MAG: hypothetical protein ACRDT6_11905 [Micromonosporaceae bacterium]
MTAPLRIAGFLVALVVALAGGLGLGRLVGPLDTEPAAMPSTAGDGHSHSHGDEPGDGHSHTAAPRGGSSVAGLTVSEAGYTLVPEATTFPAGKTAPFRFRITDRAGRPVLRYAVSHERLMHLIVVRRDLTGYQHLHPSLDADGTWSAPLRLPAAGSWRAFADFTALDAKGATTPVTLGVDLSVAGEYLPAPLPAATAQDTVDGYEVTLSGAPAVRRQAPLQFTVRRDGKTVTDLEPYLGAYGHLGVLRDGDLGYVHAHADKQLADGAIRFWVTVPSPGWYRMFLDFQVGGEVRTAEFTVTAG